MAADCGGKNLHQFFFVFFFRFHCLKGLSLIDNCTNCVTLKRGKEIKNKQTNNNNNKKRTQRRRISTIPRRIKIDKLLSMIYASLCLAALLHSRFLTLPYSLLPCLSVVLKIVAVIKRFTFCLICAHCNKRLRQRTCAAHTAKLCQLFFSPPLSFSLLFSRIFNCFH